MKNGGNAILAVGAGLFLMLTGLIGGDGHFMSAHMRSFFGLGLALVGLVLWVRNRKSS